MKTKFKKIAFLGDSITEGAFASSNEKIYHQVTASILGIECLNFGKGGARLARQKNKEKDPYYEFDFQKRMHDIPSDCDFIFVFGGVNDFSHGDALIGDFASTDPYTFVGGVRNVAAYLSSKFGKDKICFILPLHCYDEDDPHGEFGKTKNPPYKPLADYISALKSVLDDLGIEALDLRYLWDKPTTRAPDGYLQDGLHPNDEGHRVLGEAIANYLINKLLINNI